MAEHEPILTDPQTPEVTTHVRDYSRFTQMLKWSAIVAAITAAVVLMIIA